MKKLISCLLVVMMLFTAASAFAEPEEMEPFGKSDALMNFIRHTDLQTKDIALQVQSGNEVDDLVIRVEGNNLHLVSRNNNVEEEHIQLDPTGIYLKSEGTVTLLRHATVTTVMQDIVNEVDAMLDEAIKSIPEDELPTEAEIKKALEEMSILAAEEEAREQADAVTLSAAALTFADKFKPESILDVKQDLGSVEISLRSEAFAAALAEAMDELLSNPDMANLVDREAAQNGGKTFTQAQKDWQANREAILEAIRNVESSSSIDEDGHLVSHFQFGEDSAETKIVTCDSDTWIDDENDQLVAKVNLGFKDEAPMIAYELSANPYSFRENMTAGDSMTDIEMYFEDDQLSSGNVVTVIEGKEWLRAGAGPSFMYIRGQNGGISTSVRQTWTGKTRYELIAETAKGEEASVILDFYEEDDSLICELSTDQSDQAVMFKVSRIDKVNIEDLSASENINEITVEKIEGELESILNMFAPAAKAE